MSEIINQGIDLVQCRRIQELAEKHGDHFLHRVFTDSERSYCLSKRGKWQHLSGRFAAKEAVLKVIGMGWRDKIAWTDVEIVNDMSGQPKVNLSGETLEICKKLGITDVLISITHTEDFAVASAIGIKK
jgi:holo-[acyl-carrier protein] synthase